MHRGVAKNFIWILVLLTFFQFGLLNAEYDDDFGFDDEDIWQHRSKREVERTKRKIGTHPKKKLEKRQSVAVVASGSGDGSEFPDDGEESDKPRFYRVTFVLNEGYTPLLKDTQSPEFVELSRELGRYIDELYDPLPGRQSFTLVDVNEVPEDKFQILVTGDIGTVEFYNADAIKSVLEDQLEVGKLGAYTVLQNGFSFTFFQAGNQGECIRADEIQCRTGTLQCLPIEARCDGKADCEGGEDEEGCPSITTPDDPTVDAGKEDAPETDIENSAEVIDYSVEPEPELPPAVVGTPRPVGPDNCRGDNKFTCVDGTVICDVERCDGNRDCPQGDDEDDCPGIVDTTLTSSSMITDPTTTIITTIAPIPCDGWQCRNGNCLDVAQRCDGFEDCDDGSDEAGCIDYCEGKGDLFCGDPGAGICNNGICSCNGGYVLKEGKCIFDFCEGQGDYFCGELGAGRCIDGSCSCNLGYALENGKCRPDGCQGEGDLYCGEYGAGTCMDGACRCNVGFYLENGKCKACSGARFLCNDGKCIEPFQKCDNNFDCLSGEDEEDCRCKPDEFQCDGSRCIKTIKVCDGLVDCLDSTDEPSSCTSQPQPVCEPGEFRCGNGSCIKVRSRCDGKVDCPADDEDEIGCPCSSNQWQCDFGECIEYSRKCNGKIDCPNDDSDESLCPDPEGCRPGYFQCYSGQCVEERFVCDGKSDCNDRSDERSCVAAVCGPNEWMCLDRKTCIANSSHCDGRKDCPDNSDEIIDCEASVTTPLVPSTPSFSKCKKDEFECTSGECIDIDMYCDAIPDCRDGSDEDNSCDATPPPPSSLCGPEQIVCGDGSCVNSNRVCDGYFDCIDGKDERDCAKCRPDEFRCESGTCIPQSRRCDRRNDCSDGSDELDCKFECRSNEFTCRDGTCIDSSRVCDQRFDCSDGSDEIQCRKECKAGEFTCGDGSCIDTFKVCDQRYDCTDASDEANCISECRSNEFQCGDGSCVDIRRVCDRRVDCRDGSDERNCRPECRSDEFQCGDGTCILENRKCDAYRDCSDGSDELGCACRSDQFRCGTGQCIDGRRTCDRNVDCPDQSDEDPALCDVICGPLEFRCQNGQQCIPSNGRCNGTYECRDSSDEVECAWTPCISGEFRCENGPCIQESLRCDGKIDCPESSDELDCPTSSSDGLNLKTYPNDQTIKEARVGREVVFQCRDEGPIRAQVQWVRGSGLPLPPGSTDRNGRLEMPNIQLDHAGTYICQAVGYDDSTSGSRVSVYLRVEPSEDQGVTVRPPQACGFNEATCMNGQCVDKSVVCDGTLDCADGSDELRCPTSGVGCEPNEFQCNNRRCVLKTWRCDGDDDCGDNSDERSCDQSPPGSTCRGDEFQCGTGSQCIPKSFHCDMEIDCQDRSDEVGCAPPTISIPPPPMLMVEVGESFSLNCTAVGKPDPEIVWRLNWGHVPPKCLITSEPGAYGSYGVITCPSAVESDQGAYSCEAINSKGSTFAIPDAIVVVKSRDGLCKNGVFNSAAATTLDCLPCFCFGITSECASTSLIVSQIPPPSGQFQIVGVTQEPRGTVAIRSPLGQNYLRSPRIGQGVQIFARDRNQLGIDGETFVFFNLPPSHRENQVKSYGGYLKYTVEPRGQGRPVSGPDAILSGNGYTLMHFTQNQIQPNRQGDVSIQFWPGDWYKRKSGRSGGDIPSQAEELATREEIMMALQNVEHLLIRANYVDGPFIDTTVSNIRMDTATEGRGDQAIFVEECRCPPGYTGLSCENCAPGFTRAPSGPWLGRCVEDVPAVCPDGSYGDPGRGVPCQPCPCPHSTGISDELRTCYLDTDGQVTCNCPTGYEGRRCQQCGDGYSGDPVTGEACKPVVCDMSGSTSLDLVNGQCQCKINVEGDRCDQCRPGTFGLSSDAPQGCHSCFCSGVTTNCGSSPNLYKSNISLQVNSQHGFTLSDSNRFVVISEGIQYDQESNGVSYIFRGGQTQRLFWSLPPIFTGNKLKSYGSHLTITQLFEEIPGSPLYEDGDVIIIGNGISIFWVNPSPAISGVPSTITIPLRENGWIRMDGRASRGLPASRDDFMAVLANIEALLVRATFSLGTTRTRISNVRMGSAVEFDNGEDQAREVEDCRCPPGYIGFSCESCAPGYYRDANDRSYSRLGSCKPCRCSQNEESCVLGENRLICQCKPGFAGEACEVEGKLTLEISPIIVQKSPGTVVQFTCNYQAYETLNMEARVMFRDGSAITPSVRETMRNGNGRGGITWSMPIEENHSLVMCKVTNNFGVVIGEVTSRIRPVGIPTSDPLIDSPEPAVPSISVTVSDSKIQIVSVGSTAYLRCSATSISRPGGRITLKWTKQGGRLPPSRSSDNGRGQLVIYDIQPDDSGTYTCEASDGISTVYDDAVLDIIPVTTQAPPPQPTISISIVEPQIQIIEVGQTTRFTCAARSISTKGGRISLRWSKQDGFLPSRRAFDDQRGRLTISDVRPEDAGTYVCTATDGVDTAYETAVLQVGGTAERAPILSIEPNFVDVQEGGQVEIRCLADGYPDPVVSWNYGTRNLPRGVTQEDGVLKIAYARRGDAGEYICTAANPSGQITGRVSIYVRGAPVTPVAPIVTLRVEPRDSIVRRGDSIRLVCNVDGGAASTPVWTKSSGTISSRGIQTGGILSFNGVTPADSGIYLCSVTTSVGAVEQAQARITVLAHRGPPTVRLEPEKQTVSQGTACEIRCFATGDPTPTIRWSKVNEEISPNIQINGPLLRIPNAKIDDRGVYVCMAENDGGVTQAAAIVEVDRREPPTVEMYPSGRQTIINGASAIFQCRVTQGIPTPVVKWSRQDGRPLSVAVEELPGGVIRFNRVAGDESGTYICTAQNDAGFTTATAVLEIQKVPSVTITPSGSYRVTNGQRVRLECRAEGDPVPFVSWRRVRSGSVGEGDSVVSETSFFSTYEIASVTSSDEGVYSCIAKNAAGVSEERLQLIVESSIPIRDPNENLVIPRVPRGETFIVPIGNNAALTCAQTALEGSRGITIEWSRADGGAMPINYYVRDRTLYITEVEPEASGDYLCEGINSAGAVVFSDRARLDVIAPPKISIQPIRQVVRPGDQVNVYCTATGDDPITISWKKLNGQLPQSVVISGGLLQFRSIEVTDAGKYNCTAQNPAGTTKATAEVFVNADSTIYSQSKNQTVQAGSDVSLKCEVPFSADLRTIWRRDRGPLPPTAIQDRNILNITNVQVTDSGRYYCEVTTQGGRNRDYILLEVENTGCKENLPFHCKNGQCALLKDRCDFRISCLDYSDEIDCNYQYRLRRTVDTRNLPVVITPNLDNVQLGDDLELRCEVKGEPSALISWSRLGAELQRNVQPLGSVLRIYGVGTDNGGVYRCTAVTLEGRQEEDYVLAIQANVASDSPLVETKSAPVGSMVVMDCRSNLQPPLTFHWSRQGGSLPMDASHQGAKLTLPSVKAEDAGTYICTVTSGLDSSTLDIPTILSVTGVISYFPQAPLSYIALPTLPDAYLQFDIELSFKPEVPDGLILYSSQKEGSNGDFVSFGLSYGYPEFRFDMGSGPALIRASSPIQVGKWHTVRLSRNKKDGYMIVNDQSPYVGQAPGKFQGLDLLTPLYIGAVPDFRNIHKQAGFSQGFVGCISRLVLSGKNVKLNQEAQTSKGITACETCAMNPCLNNGVCQEAYAEQGYSCLCTPGFSGYHCEKIGETCYAGGCGGGRCVNEGASFQCYCPMGTAGAKCEEEIKVLVPSFKDGAYIAYQTPKALRRFITNIKFKTNDLKDSVILYCGQNSDGQGDFVSIAIKDGHVEFRFDTGSGPAILRSERPIRASEWITIKADRSLRDGSLIVNDMPVTKGKSPGTMGGLNLKTSLYIGGWDRQKIKISPGVGVSQPLSGCISNITVSSLNLDLIKSAVDSANVENCDASEGACTSLPCRNGGECIDTGYGPDDYACECPPGFSGIDCERKEDACSSGIACKNEGVCVVITGNEFRCLCPKGWSGKTCEDGTTFGSEASFGGNSYVELDRLMLPHTSSAVPETIAIVFSTTDSNGILFWHGQKPEIDGRGQDYLSIAIVDGFVEFSYELGSGPARIVAPVKVNDGKRHRIVARRTARDGSLEVDSFYNEQGQSGGTLQMMNTRGSIYIGGAPDVPLMTGKIHRHGFRGCIHKLSIQQDNPVDFYNDSLSSVNVTPCTRRMRPESSSLVDTYNDRVHEGAKSRRKGSGKNGSSKPRFFTSGSSCIDSIQISTLTLLLMFAVKALM
ncbi:basement membrane-specific heparan sulfate proteoglycan core protein-like isoform X5 [Artemia franciscana]|uniref:basement membrane-specific heparan sulfate proteoglycan core protein-like isoform X5 n=1 Tax=Artemia franciscana TaxID=6661 RepID=UPI0032DBC685